MTQQAPFGAFSFGANGMKRAIAKSRCEVGGKVYLPGDDMELHQFQLDYLLEQDAVEEVRLQSAIPKLPTGATLAELDEVLGKKFGKPKKEK